MSVGIVDAVIIIIIIISILGGLRRGFIKEIVFLIGLIVACVASFYLKTYVATFFYRNLPFISDNGLFSKFSSLNIVFYELVAFVVTFSVLYLILRILLAISGLIEKVLKCTIILGFFSRIGGAILGAVEGYIIVFMCLFIINQPIFTLKELDNSKLNEFILEKTPVLSSSVKGLRNFSSEVKDVISSYKGDDSTKFNEKTIDLLLKYDIVDEENINYLKKKGKIK